MREALAIGTYLRLRGGGCYEICGAPMGQGGGSLIYPVRRVRQTQQGWEREYSRYALKECFPESLRFAFCREASGQVVPAAEGEEAQRYLSMVQQMQCRESLVTEQVNRTGFRLTPALEWAREAELSFDGGAHFHAVANTVSVYESLQEKGRALRDYLAEQGRLPLQHALLVTQQVLLALEQVHSAGYLHLDVQDGNVFVKGSLSKEDHLVTLIDFGSARAREADGRTAPIADRVLFSTRGFLAPEAQRGNDGTLRLGPEADLYSVGCLLHLMLTGSRATREELESAEPGAYLTRFQLRRIKCPAHLTDTLQKLLTCLLERDPEQRAQSCTAVLPLLSGLLQALRPYRSELAGVSYDAFLSYKHGPIDSKAALCLQTQLEHYRIPSAARGEKRRFGRIFVDEGELSSGADYGAAIREALKNSEWLIVLCSPDTPASPWVELEIKTFLEYHDRSRVLAVLTSGSPEESFPPSLRKGKSGEEVLAADARGERWSEVERKLKGDALLRIAAPMLHTTYDTLKQRRRLYRMQRLTIGACGALALAMGFSAYAIHQNQLLQAEYQRAEANYLLAQENYGQAQENYRQAEANRIEAEENRKEAEDNLSEARLNQSVFLANAALDRLEKGDRLTAIALAMQALPQYEGERPYAAEAEYALTNALYAYRLGNNFGAVCQFEHTKTVTDFKTDPTERRLFSLDLSESVYCWDTASHQLCYKVGKRVNEFLLCPDGSRLYLLGSDGLQCRDSASGDLLWERTDIAYYVTGKAVFSPDGASLLLLSDWTCLCLDAQSGEELERCDLTQGISPEGYVYPNDLAISRDGRWLAFKGSYDSVSTLYCFDRRQGVSRKLLEARYIAGFAFDEDGNIAALWYPLSEEGGKGALNASAYFFGGFLYYRSQEQVTSFDPVKGKALWSVPLESHDVDYRTELCPVRFPSQESEQKAMLITSAEQTLLVDSKTGKLLRRCELPASILDTTVVGESIYWITTDGTYARGALESDPIVAERYLNDWLDQAQFGRCLFARGKKSHSILLYDRYLQDPNAVTMDDYMNYYDSQVVEQDGLAAVQDQDNGSVCLWDLKKGELRFRYEAEGALYPRAMSKDGKTLYLAGGRHYADLYAADTETGALTQLELPVQPEHRERYTIYPVYLRGDWVVYAFGNTNETTLVRWNRVTDETEQSVLQNDGSPDALVWDREGERVLCKPHLGEWTLCPFGEDAVDLKLEGKSLDNFAVFSQSDDRFALADRQGDRVVLYAPGGRVECTIDLGGAAPSSGCFSPDGKHFLLLRSDGNLMVCSAEDGSLEKELDLELSTYSAGCTWTFTEDALILQIGSDCLLLDLQRWEVKSFVDSAFCYSPSQECFLLENANEGTIVLLPHYSLEELMKMAQEQLGTFALSEAQRSFYGLSE